MLVINKMIVSTSESRGFKTELEKWERATYLNLMIIKHQFLTLFMVVSPTMIQLTSFLDAIGQNSKNTIR